MLSYKHISCLGCKILVFCSLFVYGMFLVSLLVAVTSVFSRNHHLLNQNGENGDRQLFSGKFNSAYGCNRLTSSFYEAHRAPLPSTKPLWTLSCPSKGQLFLWKALNGCLLTFGSNISPDAILIRRPFPSLCPIVLLFRIHVVSLQM